MALGLLGSCGGEKKVTSSTDSMLYGIPVNTISVKGVTETNIAENAFWKIPVDPAVKFFKQFDAMKSGLKSTNSGTYRTNDIRILVQAGKRQLFVDKSGTMHEGDKFYQMNEGVNNLIKSISPDSVRGKLSYDFMIARR
jgi:hypothetical protein